MVRAFGAAMLRSMRVAVVGSCLLLAACGGRQSSDAHACGYPAYDCLGGTCVEGTCQPVRLAAASSVSAVAVDETRVYWATYYSSEIDWAAKDGSAQGTLATVPACSTLAPMLAVDASFVYRACGGELLAIAKDGTAATTLLDGGATGVTVSPSGRVVVAANGVLEAWPPDGGAPLADGGTWGNLTSDDTAVYWTDFDAYQFFFHPPCDDAGRIFSTSGWSTAGQPSPFGMTSNGSALVWTDMCARTVNVTDDAGVTTTIASGLGERPSIKGFVDPPPAATGALAADGVAAYVFATTSTPQVMSLVRVPLDGGAPASLGAETIAPSNVASDETALYFGSGDVDAGVYRLAKPRP